MKEFDNYVSKYNLSNYDIYYKYHHSYRVKNISDMLAKKLKWKNDDISLARYIGLLHDIGRFEQLKIYHTFEDKNSIDHAFYGCKILFEDGLIHKFKIKEKDYEIIKKAIYNHNKIKIEESIDNERILNHIKLIRDADKIDILASYTDLNHYNITENLDDVKKSREWFF